MEGKSVKGKLKKNNWNRKFSSKGEIEIRQWRGSRTRRKNWKRKKIVEKSLSRNSFLWKVKIRKSFKIANEQRFHFQDTIFRQNLNFPMDCDYSKLFYKRKWKKLFRWKSSGFSKPNIFRFSRRKVAGITIIWKKIFTCENLLLVPTRKRFFYANRLIRETFCRRATNLLCKKIASWAITISLTIVSWTLCNNVFPESAAQCHCQGRLRGRNRVCTWSAILRFAS